MLPRYPHFKRFKVVKRYENDCYYEHHKEQTNNKKINSEAQLVIDELHLCHSSKENAVPTFYHRCHSLCEFHVSGNSFF